MKQTTQNYKGFHNWSLAFQTNKEATEGLASNSCSHQSPTGRQKWRRGDGRLWRMRITQIPALQANRHKTPLPDNQRVHTMLTWLAQRGTSSQGRLRQPSLTKKTNKRYKIKTARHHSHVECQIYRNWTSNLIQNFLGRDTITSSMYLK